MTSQQVHDAAGMLEALEGVRRFQKVVSQYLGGALDPRDLSFIDLCQMSGPDMQRRCNFVDAQLFGPRVLTDKWRAELLARMLDTAETQLLIALDALGVTV